MKGFWAGAFAVTMLAGTVSFGYAADGEPQWHTSSSLIGEPKYPAGFKHYDHVNPDAPKGGALNQVAVGTFNSFNPYVVQGVPAAGLAPFGGGMLYDTLMSDSLDQGSTQYPLIAEALQYPDDYSWVKFKLNPNAKWHDGQPITVDDVIWSFDVLKKQSPMYNKYYGDVEKAEKTGDYEVKFTFSEKGNRELPQILGQLAVLPKHWWEGKDAQGRQRDISRPTLEIPLGSAAYKIKSAVPGSSVVWERVADYWGKDLPDSVGRNNFDEVRYEYYLSEDATWEAFKKGGQYDYRNENRAQRWAEQYNFPAVQRGDVVKKSFPYNAVGRMQGYFLNTRKDKFKDPKVREALTYAFDFETMNRLLFFNQYTRINSYFSGNELQLDGPPTTEEKAILETVKDALPAAALTDEFKAPVYDTPQATRDNLRKALQLFGEAGWKLQNNKLVDANGKQFTIEFLDDGPTFERVHNLYIQNLKKIGIDARIRTVDAAQYQARLNDFDYDVISSVTAQTASPGNEQRDMWGSKAADFKGSRNYAGIKNPAIDKLIDRIIYAKDRDELVAASHALDRALLWNYYVIPQWYSDHINVAYWNKFGMPDKQPDYMGIDPFSWWVDPAKESKIKTGTQ
ncbi:extracellular solute-binding protein [Brucella pseudogrignonensis]|uniref:Microcin C transport system substrate-binding protein n=1 Tax=Brucella pseudogrignonensis TaxID=419475 RepID=A0ABU1M9H7_9HYPH|nr:extracellular solute-binding protein [Brucella pseudogrignonensis]MDR6432679.1 microcin C transport system substrate-binding protein [Brucella pseudogrignonensis]